MQIEFVSEEKPKGLLIEPVDVQESPGFFSMMGRGLTKGVLDIAQSTGTGLRWLGTRTGMESLQRAGETTEKYWEEAGKPFEAPPELQGAILENPALMKDPAWWAYNVANIVPSFAASMVPGIGAYKYINVAGKAVKFTPQVIEKLAKVGAAVTGGVSGGSLEGANIYQEIIKKGGSEQDAAKAGEIMTLASTGLNALSVGKALTPGALGRVKHVLTSAGVESITEYLEEPAEAAIKYGMGYATPEEVKRQLIEGANVIPPTLITGGLGGAAGRAAMAPAQAEATTTAPPTETQKVVQKYRERAAKREKALKIEPVEEAKEEAAPAQELKIEPVEEPKAEPEKKVEVPQEAKPEEKAEPTPEPKKEEPKAEIVPGKEAPDLTEEDLDKGYLFRGEGPGPRPGFREWDLRGTNVTQDIRVARSYAKRAAGEVKKFESLKDKLGKGEFLDTTYGELEKMAKEKEFTTNKELTEHLKSQGVRAVRYSDVTGENQIVVLDKSLLKETGAPAEAPPAVPAPKPEPPQETPRQPSPGATKSETPSETLARIDKENDDFARRLNSLPEGTKFTLGKIPGAASFEGIWEKVSLAGDPFWKNQGTGEYKASSKFAIDKVGVGEALRKTRPPLSEAQKGLTYQELNRQVKEYKGTGGISSEGKMKPGFKDKETGEVYPSLDAEGNEASVHLLDGLPEGVVLRKNEHGEVTEVKGAIEPGFIKEGKFLTRDEAVAEARRAKFGAKEAPSPSLATSTPTQKLQSVVAVKNLKTGEVYTGPTHAQIIEERGLNPAAGGEEWTSGYQVGGKFYKGEKEALAALKKSPRAPEIPQVEGLRYGGVQKIPGYPDQYVFTDEKTGSTFYSKDLGPKALEAKRDEMRARFAAEAAPEAKPGAPAKEAWKMTQAEWNSKTRFYRSGNTKNAQLPTGERVVLSLESTATNFLEKSKSFLDEMRKRVIQNALSEGKPVPPEVLKDYPDLAPKPPIAEPGKEGGEGTLSYTFKKDFEEQNRQNIEGLSYIGELVSREERPNDWVKVTYRKKAVEIQKPIAPAKESAYTESKEAENAPGGGQAVREGQLVAGSSPVAGGEQAGDREEAVSPEQARPENVPEPQGEAGSESGLQPHPQEKPASRRGRRTGNVPDNQPAPEREPAGAPAGEPETENPPVGREPRRPEDRNHVIAPEDIIFPAGKVSRINANVNAIELLRTLEKEDRNPTPEEKKILAQFTGWGALAQDVFEMDRYVSRDQEGTGELSGWMYSNEEKKKYKAWFNRIGKRLHPDLGGILTQEEWDAAKKSTLNAHYTSREVIDNALWPIVERLGVKGGTIVEPSAGVGHILSLMPPVLSGKSRIVAVELDKISGGILNKLYPEANVQITGFQSARGMKDNYADLVISNFPFGDYPVTDPKHKDYSGWSIHNYFFARSIDAVKPGGIVVGITSHYSLDAPSSAKVREYLAKKADLVGAIRLPGTAFEKSAGTSVTTDILIFRKKDSAAFEGAQSFHDVMSVKTKAGDDAPVNEYFVNHPEMVLGEHSMEGTMYGGKKEYTLEPRKDKDLTELLREAVQKLPADIAGQGAVSQEPPTTLYAEQGVKEGQIVIGEGGRVYRNEEGVLVRPSWAANPKKAAAAKTYIGIRDAARALIGLQLQEGATDDAIVAQRKKLNEAYDAFVRKQGFVSDKKNGWLSDDSDYPLALSLEVPGYIIKESTYASGERKGQKYTFKETIYKKAKIFTERTIFPFVEPRSADSLEDALKISMTYRNALDPAYIAKLVNSDVEKVQTEMAARGIAFLDPNTGLLRSPEDYLSGNVKEKLVKAEEAAKDDPRYEKNVEALKKVQPEDLKIDQIHVRLGTPWLPTEAYQDFIAETMDVRASVKYQRTSETSGFRVDAHAYGSAKATNVWGVEGATGIALVEDSLNLRFPTIYDHWMEDGKEMRQKNEQKTLAAREMQKRIQAEFEKWIRNHEKWSKEAETIFNRDFNNSVLKTFFVPDLDYYPGASHTITLRPHQKRAVSRALQESCLLAHAVGTGKTYIFTTIAAEMRRLKTARKPMIVVQGSTINQYARAYRELYPLAKVLIPNERQMEAKNRKKLLSQIATGDWDAIIVPHSAFNLLSVSPEKEAAYIRESIAELESLIREAEDTEGKKSRTVKQLEKMKERKEERIKSLLSVGREKILSFDELGIDALLIDEAHQYKRSEFYSKMSNVKGIDQGSAARSTLLLLKAREVHLKTAGKNIITATGTPISNTMAELWTMLRYVRPDLLRAYSSEGFDEFAATFGTVVSQIEETETGSFKDIARFAKYVNGPELLTMWRTAADVILAEDVKVPRPTIRTGKPIDLQIERPPEVAEFIRGIKTQRDAWDRLPGKEKMENRHVPLVLFGQAKKGAIDLRLVDRNAPDLPGSKVNRAVENIVQRWKDTKANRGTQVIYSDMYQSPDKAFNLFEDMKKKLVAKGIPAEEIAIIHDFKTDERRETLFERVNEGEVRVVMGSTEKLGVGVNIQERLASAHHIDTPLRPMDFEQRNGRIWRPGNTNEEIEILVYGMKNTLDSTSFQRLLTKQKFINQVLRGDIRDRSFEDPFDPTQETFQNMIAAFGNPLVREKFALENSIRELEYLRDAHQKEIGRARGEIRRATTSVAELEKLKGLWERRAEEVKKAAPEAKATDFKIEGSALTRDEFVDLLEKDAKALDPAAKRLESVTSLIEYADLKKDEARGPIRKGQVNGIPFNVRAGLDYFYERVGGLKALKVTVNGAKFSYQLYPGEENNLELQRTVNTADGVITSIGHMFKKIVGNPAEFQTNIDHNKKQIQDLSPLLDQPFPREQEIVGKREKLAEVDAQLKAAENEDLKKARAQIPEEEQRHEAIEARKEALRPELELQRFRGLFDEGNSQHKARLNSIVDATIDEALKKGEELDERPVAEIAEELRNLHNWTEEQIQGDDASARLGREVVDSYLRRPEERANLPLPKILMDEAGFIDLTLLTGGLATVIERARDRLQRARLADYFNWMRGHNEPGIRVLMGPEKHGPQTGESLRNMESVLSQTKASRSIYEGGRQFKEDTVRDFNRWKRKAQEILNPLSKEEKAAVVEILDTTEEIEGGHPVEIAAAQMRETLSRFREWMIEKGQKVGYIEGYFPHVFQGKFWIRQEGEFARKVDSLDEALKLAREAHERTGNDITIMQDTFIPPDDATMLSNRGYWRLVNTLQEEIGQAIPVMEELSREDIDHLLRGEGIARPKPRKRFFGNLMPRLVNNPNFMRDIDKVMDLFFYGGSRKVHQDIFMRGVQRNLEAMPVQDDRLKKFIEQTYLPGVLAHPTNFEEAIAKAISMGIAPWKGAVGGAAGGFLLGGPVGAGIGAVAGIIATRTPLLHRPGVSGQDVRKWMHNINLVQYVYDLGLSASSAVANASQFFINAYPIVGEKSAGLGYYRAARTFRDPALMTEVENMGITSGVSAMTGQPLLKKESLQGFARKITLQEGVGEFAEAALVMFQGVELQNRFAAYWAGKDRAIRGLNRGETAMPLAKKVAPKTSSLMALAAEIDLRMQDTTTRRTGSWWRKTRAMRERFAREFGYELNEKTNFRVGRENLPSLLRNVPVRILSPYKSFLMNQLKFTLETLSPKGLATDPKKALRFVGMSLALAGVAGNPILYGIFLAVAKLYKWLFDRDLEKEVRRLGIYRGITGRAGLDISGSVAIQLPSKPEDLLGRFGKLALELGELRYAKTKGEGTIFTERQAKRLTMPAQLQRAVDALTILKEGQYVTPIKQTPVALTEAPWTAAVKRFLGMMPVDVSSTFDREKMIQEKKAKFKSLSADMTERLTAAIREGDETEINLLALKFARQVNDAAERLTRASAGKNQDALIEALTDLTFWQSWIENKPKFKEALLRKLIPRQAGGMRRLPKYLRPEAATTP